MNDRRITIELETTGVLHVGNGEEADATDAPLHRDAFGQVYLPGTHIAGRLREGATRLGPAAGFGPCLAHGPVAVACDCPVCGVFGHRRLTAEEDDKSPGTASRVWVFDAPVELAGTGGATIVRDGVGIDRRWGASAAASRARFDREWLPAGTRLRVRIEIEAKAPDNAEAVFASALAEWAAGRGRLGAGAARGGGGFRVTSLRMERADLDGDALLDFLAVPGGGPAWREDPGWLDDTLASLRAPYEQDGEQEGARTGGAAPERAGALEFRPPAVHGFACLAFDLEFDGAVLVKDPAASLIHGVDAVPVHAVTFPDWTSPVLPGSCVRGVLRAQVERIARTLATASAAAVAAVAKTAPAAADKGDPDGRAAVAPATFAGMQPACDPFNDAPEHALVSCARRAELLRRNDPDADPPDPCPTCRLFGSTVFGSRLWLSDGRIDGAPAYDLRDFLAIDRFTGGALEGKKFDALPLRSPVFRFEALLWDPHRWELAALLHALRDLRDGLSAVGMKAAAGFGVPAVANVSLVIGAAAGLALPDLASLGPAPPAEWSGILRTRTWSPPDLDALLSAMTGEPWPEDDTAGAGPLAALIGGGMPAAKPVEGVRTDHYFGGRVAALYPVLHDIDDPKRRRETLSGKEVTV